MNESRRKEKGDSMQGPDLFCSNPVPDLPAENNLQILRRPGRRQEPIKAPPGYLFAPTDEDLAFKYLLGKKLRNLVPYDVVREADVYETHPEKLTQKFEKWGANGKWYFFTTRRGDNGDGHTNDRVGYWKATRLDEQMQGPYNKVAVKKTLVYYLAKPPLGTKTTWIMRQIVLVDAQKQSNNPDVSMTDDELALCVITRKRLVDSD
ncbi:uncharacterized protein A4U43_C03F17690 [Asparagus officinalis]|uniref:NAC domain-containing protein n=2 Tax=Asparagus officinalis TaxID=4686 RepID=A0A5P1FBU6_ASPOF|nr:uncharacterized protein A4U43_C03F17690 [Asparagus officinalis]